MLRDLECVVGDFLLMAAPHVVGLVLPVDASTLFCLDFLGVRAVIPFPYLVVGLTTTLSVKRHRN